MMKLAEKEKREHPRGSTYSIACWFERAERFQPDDVTVKSLSALYLARHGKKQEAITKLDEAVALGVESPTTGYNIGLAYFDAGQYDKALASAQQAYAAGFPLPGLRDKLKRIGKWRDLPPQDVGTPAAVESVLPGGSTGTEPGKATE
jgi:tetratricopeptide (TPR) repeat protein